MSRLEEITVTVRRERHRWDDTVLLECALPNDNPNVVHSLDVKTTADPGELTPRLTYRFYGRWYKHPKYGRQFLAKTFVKDQPHGQAGVVCYLMQAPHIGPATAGELWRKFGSDAVRIVREDPEVAAAAAGGRFDIEKARDAAEFLEKDQAVENLKIDLMDLLEGRGFPRDTGRKAMRAWGNRAPELLRRNPFLLMQFKRCGFLRTDKMYHDLGGDPAKMKRQVLCGWYTLFKDSSGHTWFPAAQWRDGVRAMVGGVDVDPVKAAKIAKRAGRIAVHRDEGTWFALKGRAENEADLAGRVREMVAEKNHHWPTVAGMDTSEHQVGQLYKALQSPLGVFSGGPGTGKTYTAAQLIRKLEGRHGTEAIAVCAPTGKAAVQIRKAMAEYGVGATASTIHRLLKVEEYSEGAGWRFEHGEGNPLPHRYIIVDEASMINTDLMAALFRACDRATQVLLIGDPGQLPPVGHGAPLRDLIAAGVPTGGLTEIRRNSGKIVQACHQIREGEQFKTVDHLRPKDGENLKMLPGGADTITSVLERLEKKGIDPIWDCQVIVALNEKTAVSREQLNERLQILLNPGGAGVPDSPFRVGDKVICLQNGSYPTPRQGIKTYACNGEIGRIVKVERSFSDAKYDDDRTIRIYRSGDQATSRFDLAYAVTCHKMQGSEIPVTIVALDDSFGAKRVCSREWLYTAISRAKRMCLLIGSRQTADGMCSRVAIGKRKTFLRELITG